MTIRSLGGSRTAGAVFAVAFVSAVSVGAVRPVDLFIDAGKSRSPTSSVASVQATPNGYHHFGIPTSFTPDGYHHFP